MTIIAIAALHAPEAVAGADWFGMNATELIDPVHRAEAGANALAAAPSAYRALAGLGVRSARVDANWASTEPVPGPPYRWGTLDRIDDDLRSLGLRWAPVLIYTPEWASTVPGESHAPPVDVRRFASFAGAFARRYGGPDGVRRYEIWNEPDLTYFWHPRADPTQFAALFVAARDAIKAVDPSAQVIIGGLDPPTGPAFISGLQAAGGEALAKADGVGYHPYSQTVAGALAGVRAMRQALAASGHPSIPLFVTEVGWPTAGVGEIGVGHLPDEVRAGDLTLLADALAASDCNVASFEPATWYSYERVPGSDSDWLGLWPHSGLPSASSIAYGQLVSRGPLFRVPGSQLGVCRGGARRPLLPLEVDAHVVRRGGDNCLAATVRYDGQPVNGVAVRVRRGRRLLGRGSTGPDGTLERCRPRRSRHRHLSLARARGFRVTASIPGVAASG